MKTEGLIPDAWTYVAALQACANMAAEEAGTPVEGKVMRLKSLDIGMELHSEAVKSGCKWDIFLWSTLVDVYAKCGSLFDAYKIFIRMPMHNVVSWTALMLGYADNGEAELALELFSVMEPYGPAPNARTYVAALKACTSLAVREEGRVVDGKVIKLESLKKGLDIHSRVVKRGWSSDMFVSSTLLDMYAKCGKTEEAREVFDKMPVHDLVSWTGMLLGYAENGEAELALRFFFSYRPVEAEPDAVACVAALRACMSLAAKEEAKEVDGRIVKVGALEAGIAVHSQVMKGRYEYDIFVGRSLIEMYCKCGSLDDARKVYLKALFRDVDMWNALMMGYADNGEPQLALEAFVFLRPENCSPNNLSFVAAAKACSYLAAKEEAQQIDGSPIKVEALERGMIIHSKAVKHGYHTDLFVINTLVDVYSNCGSMLDARMVFDKSAFHNVVSYNGLILGYADNGEPETALELFSRMQQELICEPNCLSFVAVFKAVASSASKEAGQRVNGQLVKVDSLQRGVVLHEQAAKAGLDLDIFAANALIDMYGKCGSTADARRVFDGMPHHNAVTWASLMRGYSDCGADSAALGLLVRMPPDNAGGCYVAALKSCGNLASLGVARAVHGEACRREEPLRLPLLTSLVGAYGKCGAVDRAQRVFDSAPALTPDVVAWTALMSGYSRQGGAAAQVLRIFREMTAEGVQPNAVTFVCVLAACSHAGLVYLGRRYFREMWRRYHVAPEIEHAVCVVDMLGRANLLDDALQIARQVEPNALVWRTLLSACSVWKNSVIGRLAFEALVEIDEEDSAAYVLLSNILKWEEQGRIENQRNLAWEQQWEQQCEGPKHLFKFWR